MDQRLIDLVRRQQAAGFPDIAGAQAAGTIPISDRLLNEIIAAYLPAGRIRMLEIHAHADDRIAVRVALVKPRFLPPFTLTVVIDRQPELPASPELVLKLTGGGGLMALAGPAIAMLNGLPPGVHIDGDRIHVNLAAVLRERGLEPLLLWLEQLRITTSEGTVILAIKFRAPPKAAPA